MMTPEEIATNFQRSYSTDGQGDNFDQPRLFGGLTLGVVVDTDDPTQGGRLRVFCPSLNDNPKKIQHLPWAAYISPFSGSIDNNEYYRGADKENATSIGSLHYGFWAVPEQGAHVLVGCIDGDPRRRFWIGCMNEHQETNTIHHGRYKWENGRVNGPLTGSNQPMQPLYDNIRKAFDDQDNSPEFRSRAVDYQTSAINEDVGQAPNSKQRDGLDQQNRQIRQNDPDTWEHDTLGAQGYDWSGFKALGGFMASRVFGFSTPGMHAFTMDDRPFNSRIRLRTTAGHQILMDDTNERIYVSTSDGNNYIEMDKSGNIDVYAKRRLSFHSENDINFQSDKSFRVRAKEGIYLYSGVPANETQTSLELPPVPGEIRIHSAEDMHILSEKNIRQLSFNDTFHESQGNLYTYVEGSMFTEVGIDINIKTSTGSINTTSAGDLNETIMRNSKRFSYGASALGSNLPMEMYSFQSTVNVAGNQAVTMKSNTSDINIEAQGQGDGTGSVSIKSPNSEAAISDQGVTVMSDKEISVKSENNIEVEVRPNGPKLSAPTVLSQIPEVPICNTGELPEVVFDAAQEFMTATQAALVAFNAGFRGKDLIIAVALMGITDFAMGVLNVASDIEQIWYDIVGPFQIQTLRDPDNYCGLDAYRDNRYGQLQDPNANARLAFRMFNEMYPQGEWSANKWDAFAGDGLAILDQLDRAMDAVASLCNVSPSDFIPPLPPLPSMPAMNTAFVLSQAGVDIQSAADITFKSMTNPALYTKSYTNMVDTIQANVVQTDQLSWMTGTYFTTITAAINAVDGGSITFPFTFDIAGLLSIIQSAGLPDIDSLAGTMPMLPIVKDIETKAIELLEIPKYDNLIGKIFTANAVPLQETIA